MIFSINGLIWEIVLVSPNHPALTQPNGEQAIGCCNRAEQTIYISAAVARSPLYREVLYHEIAHAAISSYGYLLPVREEEFLAEFISSHGDEILAIVDRFS